MIDFTMGTAVEQGSIGVQKDGELGGRTDGAFEEMLSRSLGRGVVKAYGPPPDLSEVAASADDEPITIPPTTALGVVPAPVAPPAEVAPAALEMVESEVAVEPLTQEDSDDKVGLPTPQSHGIKLTTHRRTRGRSVRVAKAPEIVAQVGDAALRIPVVASAADPMTRFSVTDVAGTAGGGVAVWEVTISPNLSAHKADSNIGHDLEPTLRPDAPPVEQEALVPAATQGSAYPRVFASLLDSSASGGGKTATVSEPSNNERLASPSTLIDLSAAADATSSSLGGRDDVGVATRSDAESEALTAPRVSTRVQSADSDDVAPPAIAITAPNSTLRNQSSAAPATHLGVSTSSTVDRIMDAVRAQGSRPQPNAILVDIPEMDGLQLRVSLNGTEVAITRTSVEGSTEHIRPMLVELGSALANKGFSLAGDRRGQAHDERPEKPFVPESGRQIRRRPINRSGIQI